MNIIRIAKEIHQKIVESLVLNHKGRLVELMVRNDPRRNLTPGKRIGAQTKKAQPLSGTRLLKRYHESTEEIKIGKTLTGNTQGNIVVVNPEEPRPITGI